VRLANGVVIDVYSIEALERLLKELKEVEPVKPVKPDKTDKMAETVKLALDNIADSSDFLANNPWLPIISKRGSE
jgi:hypothetical protein